MPPRKPKPATPKLSQPVNAHKHADKRANIPTEELRDFIADEEKAPKTVLYPRDPSLDPQLVWKGKDEQDKQDLAVPAVPIYIQEHIKPQNIIELVRTNSPRLSGEGAGGEVALQPMLFGDFNGLSFEDRVDFYHHEQHWSNRMILGDSLMVMTSLAEKEGLKGKVQMIYFDPPYGIKFGSNWQVSTRKRDVKDGKAEDTTRQPEQVKAFRDTWKYGIHSYLAYLRDRLVTARELLTESGSIFIQIGDENVHVVRNILDEVFGSENFISLITIQKMAGLASKFLKGASDYVLWYGKDINQTKYRTLLVPKVAGASEGTGARYDQISSPFGERQPLPKDSTVLDGLLHEGWRIFQHTTLTTFGSGGSSYYPFRFNGKDFFPITSKGWLTTHDGLQRLAKASRVAQTGASVRYIRYLEDFPSVELNNVWTDLASPPDVVYVVQTHSKVIERCMMMTTDPGDLVLDPTCGSGTTAYVAEQWGRRWITIDTSRVSIALARTRLMSGRYPYYLLADSVEGRRKEAELNPHPAFGTPLPEGDGTGVREEGDIKRGFVYERVPHVTLKSIANNEEIDEIHAKYQGQLDELRAQINKAAKQKWEEWEIPRESPSPSGRGQGEGELSSLLTKYWKIRQERQRAIDASIARRADTEFLYDKPYQDNKRVRVSGPFTVESLSPHRVLAPDDPATTFKEDVLNTHDFTQMILENLKSAGVQNTVKNQRLKFDSLEPYAGTWIHAVGEYTEKDGKPRRAALSIGPELGTVSAEQVKEAAKEAVLGVGFDLLIICGFAFDPHVSEEAKRYGKLTVLPTRMNPDLAMGDELLKKTGAGNLFMVFGEPDVEIKKKDGNLTVRLNGLDVYDPTTGEIRSNSTDDIACWFLDTDYNGESFIVRHAYFTGADEPYDKLKRALRAEIDESAWSMLYTNTSVPFEKPSTGKIAVKVINHYGDEVLKVFEVE
jgi:adenine-specific DNA-methyltransferase